MNKLGQVNCATLNMRSYPSTDSKISIVVGQLKKGDRITIFETKEVGGILWAKSYPCKDAPLGYWVSTNYLTWIKNDSQEDTIKPIISKKNFEYKKIENVHVVKVNPLDISLEIGEKLSLSKSKFKTGINGTFFWYLDTKKTKTYPTSILQLSNKVHQNRANHFPSPQSCLIIYKDGVVDTKRIKDITEITSNNIHIIISGVGLTSTHYPYSPSIEGFKGSYTDVLRKCNKTFIGYNLKENKIWLMQSPNATHNSLVEFCKKYGLMHAISLDGGGSSSLKVDGVIKQKTDGRLINNFIVVK